MPHPVRCTGSGTINTCRFCKCSKYSKLSFAEEIGQA